MRVFLNVLPRARISVTLVIAFWCLPGLAQVDPFKVRRLPIPSTAKQAEATKLVRDVYKNPDAKTLIRDALDTKDNMAAKYVMLVAAERLAVGSGDVQTAVQAIEEISNVFEVDVLRMKGSMVFRLSQAAKTTKAHGAVVDLALQTADEAIDADQYDAAEKLVSIAKSAATRSRDANRVKRARAQASKVARLQRQFVAVDAAIAKLAADPNDPEANLVTGRFRALVQGRWEDGLPLLAIGSDPRLKSAAKIDLSNPVGAARKKLGDAWWEAAKVANEDHQEQLRARAQFWYRKALPELTGLHKKVVEDRLKIAVASSVGSTSPDRPTPKVQIPKQARTYLRNRYMVYTAATTHTEAKRKCEEMGGHLVRIESARENLFILKVLLQRSPEKQEYWIDGSDKEKEGTWMYSDGTPFKYSNWAPREPNNGSGSQHYVALAFHRGGQWDDQDKTIVHPFICEWERERR